ncbi:hypothetical protein LZ31DRAFT_550495 [Colletotrichum somersetense]|nr:hypothetical protein LZ31DRAFT_550495 [Colletotrichum somersetense]
MCGIVGELEDPERSGFVVGSYEGGRRAGGGGAVKRRQAGRSLSGEGIGLDREFESQSLGAPCGIHGELRLPRRPAG